MILELERSDKVKTLVMNQHLLLHGQTFILSKISYPEHIDEMGALRIEAWKTEQGISQSFFSKNFWIDEQDQNAHHWMITKDGKVVASARLSIHHDYDSVPHSELFSEKDLGIHNVPPFASINRLVVDPAQRGMGLATILDRVRIVYALSQNVNAIIAQPIESRVEALKRLDFNVLGRLRAPIQFPDMNIFFMIRELSENRNVEY